MKLPGKLLAGLAAMTMTTSAAIAADIPMAPPVISPVVTAPPSAPQSIWPGWYVGFYGAWVFYPSDPWWGAGVQFGYNFVRGRFLGGFEIDVGPAIYQAAVYCCDAFGNVRAGFILGERVLVYGEAGIGAIFLAPVWKAGGGLEFAVGQRMSIFAEAKVASFIPTPTIFYEARGGLNFHLR
jgi:hypothetical protein